MDGPFLKVSATVLDFGVVGRGDSSAPQLLRLTNSDDSPVEVTRSLAGDDHFLTSVDDVSWTTGSRTVPAHGSLLVQVRYSPGPGTALGARTLLSFHSASSGQPLSRILLAGMARQEPLP